MWSIISNLLTHQVSKTRQFNTMAVLSENVLEFITFSEFIFKTSGYCWNQNDYCCDNIS